MIVQKTADRGTEGEKGEKERGREEGEKGEGRTRGVGKVEGEGGGKGLEGKGQRGERGGLIKDGSERRSGRESMKGERGTEEKKQRRKSGE